MKFRAKLIQVIIIPDDLDREDQIAQAKIIADQSAREIGNAYVEEIFEQNGAILKSIQ